MSLWTSWLMILCYIVTDRLFLDTILQSVTPMLITAQWVHARVITIVTYYSDFWEYTNHTHNCIKLYSNTNSISPSSRSIPRRSAIVCTHFPHNVQTGTLNTQTTQAHTDSRTQVSQSKYNCISTGEVMFMHTHDTQAFGLCRTWFLSSRRCVY